MCGIVQRTQTQWKHSKNGSNEEEEEKEITATITSAAAAEIGRENGKARIIESKLQRKMLSMGELNGSKNLYVAE